ncbi:MAG: transporter [Candidatus Omnitrophica bacterium]|nr:transporter [Candidatus Omnitrophota bacterium]MCG2702809.1 transporter [Candidatus Omnitrophota bacterium]
MYYKSCKIKYYLVILSALFSLIIVQNNYCMDLTNDFRTEKAAYEEFLLWGISASLDFKSGDYGAQTTTSTIYMPFELSRYFSKGELSFTIPYIQQESEEQVKVIGGKPFRSKVDRQTQTKTTESGLGDIILKGEYDLWTDQADLFFVSVLGAVKLPTADEDKGLGTGEYDFTFGVKNKRLLNEKWKMYAGFYYTFIGEPSNEKMDNELAFDLGVSCHVLKEVEARFFYEQSTAIIPGDADPKSVVLGISYQLEKNIKLFGDLSLGLSEGSADIGLSLGINAGF